MKICVDPNGRIKLRAKQKYEILSATDQHVDRKEMFEEGYFLPSFFESSSEFLSEKYVKKKEKTVLN